MVMVLASDSFTRPADTTAYADNDLVANDVDAADVVPMEFNFGGRPGGRIKITGARLFKSDGADVANATFWLHLWTVAPTPTNGDNGALADATGALFYIGHMVLDMTATGLQAFGDGVSVNGVPVVQTSGYIVDRADDDLRVYGLLEAKAAYTPASAEVFTVHLLGENEMP